MKEHGYDLMSTNGFTLDQLPSFKPLLQAAIKYFNKVYIVWALNPNNQSRATVDAFMSYLVSNNIAFSFLWVSFGVTYPNDYGNTPELSQFPLFYDGNTVGDYSDFVPYDGWVKPSMKKLSHLVTTCNWTHGVDLLK